MRLLPLLILFAAVIAVALWLRPLMPVDETRYLAVAWEMWQRGEFLVPHLNGEPYSHKPPLLFWLIHLGWWLFGVNELWPRLIGPLFALGSLLLLARVAVLLWPGRPRLASLAVMILASSVYWLGFSTAVMFDMPVVFFVLLGVWGLLQLEQGRARGWLALFLGVALGGLVKGPFPILYLAFITLSAPLWMRLGEVWWRWYLRAALVGLAGVVVVLAWAIPAALHGGERYAAEILWGQMAGRTVEAFDHARPLWWYLPILLAMLLPLPLWKGFWQGVWFWLKAGEARRGLWLGWVLAPFLLFSLVSGKQPHYLLPVLPALALLVARGMEGMGAGLARAWGVGLFWCGMGAVLLIAPWGGLSAPWSSVLQGPGVLWAVIPLVLGLAVLWHPRTGFEQAAAMYRASAVGVMALLLYAAPLRPHFDLAPFARELGRLEPAHALAVMGEYRGEYHFLGRLARPLQELWSADEARVWCEGHPEGVVLVTHAAQGASEGALARTRYRSRWVAAWPCAQIEVALR